jgi:hypothetical protein
MRRILAFFRERESRDELGLGAIRDSIADKLFPGTSTLQTRLRYMMFVPWMYRRLEDQGIASSEIESRARNAELALIAPLMRHAEDGVIGRVARGNLKTLPSSIYWAGLFSWGVLQYSGSQSDYHHAFDRISDRRISGRWREDRDVPDELATTWHGGVPQPPEDFPEQVSFALTPEEARYLGDRVREQHPDSLLSHLVHEGWIVPEVAFIWDHPRLHSFRPQHIELVHHARLFAQVMHGAAILYNLELARIRDDQELLATYEKALADWSTQTSEQLLQVRQLDFNRLWDLVHTEQHRVSGATRMFVARWFDLARKDPTQSVDDEPARRLIRERERSLKGVQSRFANRVALTQWTGGSGMAIFNYRWRTAASLLRDFHLALAAGGG